MPSAGEALNEDNKKKLDALWDIAALSPGTPVDIGRIVVCDVCGRDYTDSPQVGGFIFGSDGYCPVCSPRMMHFIGVRGEQEYIRARCPAGTSFADFIRAYRGGNTLLTIRKAR